MSILSVVLWTVIGSTVGSALGVWLIVEWLVSRETRRGAQRREVYARHRTRLLAARRTRLDLAVRAGDTRVAGAALSRMSAVPDDDAGVDPDPTCPVAVLPDAQRSWKTKLWPKSTIDRKRIYFTEPPRDWVDAATDERQATLKAMQKQYHEMRNDEFAAYLRGERPDPRD